MPGAPVQGYDSYSVTLSADPFGPAGTTAIVGLRQRLVADAPGALVGGNPAIAYDESQTAGRDDVILIPLVLAVIFAVIALLLRAIVAPAVLVATTALSFAASFGLSNLLWRHGLGYPGVESVIPIYIFIFLVALGVDYNIFLSARIREESRRLGLRGGTVRGLGVTGGVITAGGRGPGRHLRRAHPDPGGEHHRSRHRSSTRRPARHADSAHHPGPRQPAHHRRPRLVARPGRETLTVTQ